MKRELRAFRVAAYLEQADHLETQCLSSLCWLVRRAETRGPTASPLKRLKRKKRFQITKRCLFLYFFKLYLNSIFSLFSFFLFFWNKVEAPRSGHRLGWWPRGHRCSRAWRTNPRQKIQRHHKPQRKTKKLKKKSFSLKKLLNLKAKKKSI